MHPKAPQNQSKSTPKSAQMHPKISPKAPQHQPKSTPTSALKHPKISPKAPQNQPKSTPMHPKAPQNQPNISPKAGETSLFITVYRDHGQTSRLYSKSVSCLAWQRSRLQCDLLITIPRRDTISHPFNQTTSIDASVIFVNNYP